MRRRRASSARWFGAGCAVSRSPTSSARGFRRLELAVDRRLLIPRPETELLVELAIELEPQTVLDVGTGSGRDRARGRRRAARRRGGRDRHLARRARRREGQPRPAWARRPGPARATGSLDRRAHSTSCSRTCPTCGGGVARARRPRSAITSRSRHSSPADGSRGDRRPSGDLAGRAANYRARSGSRSARGQAADRCRAGSAGRIRADADTSRTWPGSSASSPDSVRWA